jgi:hypothetical protein
MLVTQLGESANELAEQWRGGYRGGFPDFMAVEPSIQPYYNNASNVYTGVLGLGNRKWLFDPNLTAYNPDYQGPYGRGPAGGQLGDVPAGTTVPADAIKDNTLSTGAKIAIGIGIAAAVVGSGAAIYFVRRRRR